MPDGVIAIKNAGTPHVVENIKNSGYIKADQKVNGESGSILRPISTLQSMVRPIP